MEVAGLLLTGGASRRMGVDKAGLVVRGERLADRGMRLLAAVCAPVIEVGPAYTRLPAVLEEPAGGGPLAAVAAGGRALRDRGHLGPALVLAVDLPLVSERLLALLAQAPWTGSVVPMVEGRPQPLCARYSADALRAAERLVGSGERSMRSLLRAAEDVRLAGRAFWGRVTRPERFLDVDTPHDLGRLRADAALRNEMEQ